MGKKALLNWIGRNLSILSIAFIGYSIWKMGIDFSFVKNVPLFIAVVLVGIGVKVASVFVSATAWTQWLSFFSTVAFQRKKAISTFCRANIGKYILGNVMHFVQRNLFAAEMGISQVQTFVTTIFEVISYVVVALLVRLLTAKDSMLLVISKYFGEKTYTLYIVAAVAVVALIVVLFLFRKKIQKALQGKSKKTFMLTLGKVMLLQLATLSMLGLILVFLQFYVTGSETLPHVFLLISHILWPGCWDLLCLALLAGSEYGRWRCCCCWDR